jgi:pentalenene oxygenase
MTRDFVRGAAPAALPVIQHTLRLVRDPLAFLRSLPAYGDLVDVRIGPNKAVMVCDPELVQRVLSRDDVFDKGGFLYDRGREVMGDGLPVCPHLAHRRQRRLAQPAFQRSRIPGYVDVMGPNIAAVVGSWQDGSVFDPLPETLLLAGRAAIATMFGDLLSPGEIQELCGELNTLFSGIYLRMLLPDSLDRLPTPANRRYHRAQAQVRRTVGRIIALARAEGTDRGDLLSTLVATRETTGETVGWSDAEILDQIVSFFLAGIETVASSLAWTLYLLATHPDVQRKLQSEVDLVLGGAAASPASLPQLVWTSQIVTESLRMYPPGWLLTRLVRADTELGGHRVPAGTTVLYSPYLLHHRADRYPDPEQFRPSRWDDGVTPPRDSYLPFAFGARRCIGDSFALAESALALAAIAARWQVESVGGREPRPTRSPTIGPRGVRLRIAARTSSPLRLPTAPDLPAPAPSNSRRRTP